MGRIKREKKQLPVYLSSEERELLEKIAAREKRDLGAMVRWLIVEYANERIKESQRVDKAYDDAVENLKQTEIEMKKWEELEARVKSQRDQMKAMSDQLNTYMANVRRLQSSPEFPPELRIAAASLEPPQEIKLTKNEHLPIKKHRGHQ